MICLIMRNMSTLDMRPSFFLLEIFFFKKKHQMLSSNKEKAYYTVLTVIPWVFIFLSFICIPHCTKIIQMSLIGYFSKYPNIHLLGQVINLGGIYNTCITHECY